MHAETGRQPERKLEASTFNDVRRADRRPDSDTNPDERLPLVSLHQ